MEEASSLLKQFPMQWGRISMMTTATLKDKIEIHMFLANFPGSTNDWKHLHINFADSCAHEIARREGWLYQDREESYARFKFKRYYGRNL